MRSLALIIFITGIFGYVLSSLLPPLTSRIVGGIDAKISEVPYQLSLFELNDFIGGAAIIGNKWTITAAHCVVNKAGQLLQNLRVGAGNAARNKGSFYNVLKIVKHSSYNMKTFENDIALLEIDGTFQFSGNVKAVKIPNSELSTGLSAVVSGWGATVEQNLFSQYPETLKKVTVSIIDRKVCKKSYSKIRRVSDSMICAGNEKGGKDACTNDSGGPLVVNNVLYGIVSWGKGCGKASFPGVYTNVAKYESWIRKNAKI